MCVYGCVLSPWWAGAIAHCAMVSRPIPESASSSATLCQKKKKKKKKKKPCGINAEFFFFFFFFFLTRKTVAEEEADSGMGRETMAQCAMAPAHHGDSTHPYTHIRSHTSVHVHNLRHILWRGWFCNTHTHTLPLLTKLTAHIRTHTSVHKHNH
eukprot:NODE_1076_length_691_cov_448.643302_g734_i0.p1 GENE.NODE_1076_length_691_cov_448.643302_g734_i0~~NODE_1076_length_691_cov_448.643302_g734_i0.p1  ORF type:complete len:154 (-),score=113.19 NODE_1076_length_691_cov_448.643302_g734_i0:40-501(-)